MEAHSKRNTKTSIMFTMAITFLVFAASSFQLITTVVEKMAEQQIGADLMADSLEDAFLNEAPIREFLNSQM